MRAHRWPTSPCAPSGSPTATYRLTGNKMWISGGDHDLADNIVHLVLAKVPDERGALRPGAGGISLFVVPKYTDGRK